MPVPSGKRILLVSRCLPSLPTCCLIVLFYYCVQLPWIYWSCRWDELLLKIRMRWQRRTISEKGLTQRIASGLEPGTFIQDSYTVIFPHARIWWTPDNIPTLGKIPFGPGGSVWDLNKEIDPFQQGLYDTYADQKKGKALLLIARARTSTPRHLQLLFPTIPQIALWSGPILWHLEIENMKAKNPSDW